VVDLAQGASILDDPLGGGQRQRDVKDFVSRQENVKRVMQGAARSRSRLLETEIGQARRGRPQGSSDDG
jgi:hypothetical protein